jgi:capsular exopolysaccharide synthesis family protein
VDAASAEVTAIRLRDKIIDPNPNDIEAGGDMETQRALLAEETKLNEATQRVDELKTQLGQIDKMTPEELMNALPLFLIPDTTVPQILPKWQDAVSEEARLTEAGLGEKHPKILALQAQKAVWKKQLDAAIDSIKKNLVNRLNIAQTYLTNEQKNYDLAKQNAQSSHTTDESYINAKEDYINEKKLLDSAQQRLSTEAMQLRITTIPAEIWDRAEPARNPSSPNVAMYLFIACVVGLGMGVGLAFFLEYLDTSVKTLADVEKFIGVSVLAVVPKIGGLLHKAEEGRSPDAETYRTLRTNIDFHKPSPDANTLTVISGGPGEGKSTTLCNLAVICANAGNNVLIVDADLRRPSQHKFFDLDGSVGLVNYVNGEKEFEDVIQQTSVDKLWLIPSGPSTKDPVAILNSHRVVELIARAKTQFDMVMFDSPPILGLSDGAVLSSVVEMTIMVVQHRRFPRASLLRVKQAVLNVGGNLTGVVLNRVDTRDDQNYYYYTSYYDYYTPSPAENRAHSKADI